MGMQLTVRDWRRRPPAPRPYRQVAADIMAALSTEDHGCPHRPSRLVIRRASRSGSATRYWACFSFEYSSRFARLRARSSWPARRSPRLQRISGQRPS